MKQGELYSHHIFTFPFRWDIYDNTPLKTVDYAKRVSLHGFHQIIENAGLWNFKPFPLGGNSAKDSVKKTGKEELIAAYNQYSYFHDYVCDAIFATEAPSEKNKTSLLCAQYERKNSRNALFSFDTKKGDKYSLYVDDISLKVFATGVGLLSLSLENWDAKQSSPEDILLINDVARRIYPQFLSVKDSSYTSKVKKAFLATEVSLKLEGEEEIKEDFSFYDNDNFASAPDTISRVIMKLLGENSFFTSEKAAKKKTLVIKPIIDDRMYTLCRYANETLANQLGTFNKKLGEYSFLRKDFWYKFIFVDGSYKACESVNMTKKLVKGSTYDRWVGSGTLFGVSRYSFVMLNKGGNFAEEVLLSHMKGVYLQLATITLMLRASVLRFSQEVARVSELGESEVEKNSALIYQEYLRFVNRLYFREVTAQEQGIELYAMMLENMDINTGIKGLESELKELHAYASMISEQKTQRKVYFLTRMGGFFLPFTLFFSILDSNALPASINGNPNWFWAALVLSILVVAGILGYLHRKE